MRITYDTTKDQANIASHGVSLSEAESLEWDALVSEQDTRKNYGEARMIGYAPIGSRLFCVVFVDRDGARRVISLRKANLREVKRYDSET